MKIKVDFNDLDNLLKRIGATENKEVELDSEIDEFVSKLRSEDGLEVKSLDDVEYDEDGYLTAFGERIVLYIKDSKNDIENLRRNPKGDHVVRYHINGRCTTLKTKQSNGTYDRYVLKSKPNGLFVVDGIQGGEKNRYGGLVFGTGNIVTESNVELGICKNCLNAIGIGHEKSAQQWRDSFNIEEFFKNLKPLKPLTPKKPRWTEDTFPQKEKRYDTEYKKRATELKKENNYRCSKCNVDLNKSLADRKYLHCHHRDGNDRNHEYANLEILCVSCHAKKGNNKNPGFPGDMDQCNRIRAAQDII